MYEAKANQLPTKTKIEMATNVWMYGGSSFIKLTLGQQHGSAAAGPQERLLNGATGPPRWHQQRYPRQRQRVVRWQRNDFAVQQPSNQRIAKWRCGWNSVNAGWPVGVGHRVAALVRLFSARRSPSAVPT